MWNPYVIILVLFVVAGFAATLWGLSVIAKGRRTLRWPSTEGTIEESRLASDTDDLFPHILFSYRVGVQTYRRELEFPSGTNPTSELAASYVKKFPAGASVRVFYNPERPDQATLEPGLLQGDWMILTLGISATIFGILLLVFGHS